MIPNYWRCFNDASYGKLQVTFLERCESQETFLEWCESQYRCVEIGQPIVRQTCVVEDCYGSLAASISNRLYRSTSEELGNSKTLWAWSFGHAERVFAELEADAAVETALRLGNSHDLRESNSTADCGSVIASLSTGRSEVSDHSAAGKFYDLCYTNVRAAFLKLTTAPAAAMH